MKKLRMMCKYATLGSEYGYEYGWEERGIEFVVDEKEVDSSPFTDYILGCSYCLAILRLRLYPRFYKGPFYEKPFKAELVQIDEGIPYAAGGHYRTYVELAPHAIFLPSLMTDKRLCSDFDMANKEERQRVMKHLPPEVQEILDRKRFFMGKSKRRR